MTIKESNNPHENVPPINQFQSSNNQLQSEVIELNIQPSASILNVFSRLNYRIWYALAEFVDNSTQSYLSHMTELHNDSQFSKLVVRINYNAKENTLTITDNAYGMEIDRFKDAILLDSKNDSQTGRNEFGMGLKTAASWFGEKWTVTSSQYGSSNLYRATIDIPRLKELNLQNADIYCTNAPVDSHGTKIEIEQVTKKITAPTTIRKVKDLLSSMYRRDINNHNIEIWFNNEPIEFKNYTILTNFRGKTWKKDLDFSVEFNDKIYRVTGFVAIMDPGSFSKSGFALFRQNRVVVGGTDLNYKPSQIFGQAQSQRSLKLFGELNMNDFPVNQAKDGFVWDDGLEDAFIDALKNNILEYIEIADLSKKERASELQYSDQASADLQENVSSTITSAFSENIKSTNPNVPNDEIQKTKNNDVDDYKSTILNAVSSPQTVSTPRTYSVPVTPFTKVTFVVQWARGNTSYWIDYTNENNDNYTVSINIDHPFFMPFSKEDGFQPILEKFAIAFILAEREAKLTSTKDGYIQANTIKNYINHFLEKLMEDN